MKRITICSLISYPWFRKTKKYFRGKNIQFEYVDHDQASEEEQEQVMKEMNRYDSGHAFPFVVIGDDITIGYDPST